MRDTRDNVLNAGCRSSAAMQPAGGVQLVNCKLHPKFRGLVLNDEQHFVVGGGKRMLRLQNLVELEIA